MKQSEYIKKLITCRRLTTDVMQISDSRIVSILERSYKDLESLLKLKEVDSLTYKSYAERKAAIGQLIRQLSTSVNVTTRLGIRSTAENVTDIYRTLTETYAKSQGFSFNWGVAFNTVPTQVIRTVAGRVWMDGMNFSDRIWRLDDFANKGVNDIVTSGISRGESAVNMSKRLRQYLMNEEITPGTSWTTGIKPSVTGQGSIHYNALRLARTEINNTYRETLVQTNEANPITLGVKWNLSGSHPQPDICDVWAEADLYGFGSGVYPAGMTPIDHPNGLCFLTQVLRPASQWNDEKANPEMQDVSKDELLSVMDGQSDARRNAAWNQFNAVNNMLQSDKFQLNRRVA
jgi:hypothetical protein